jgi:hypothetical protein
VRRCAGRPRDLRTRTSTGLVAAAPRPPGSRGHRRRRSRAAIQTRPTTARTERPTPPASRPVPFPPCAAAQVDHETSELAPAPVSSQRRHGPRARAATAAAVPERQSRPGRPRHAPSDPRPPPAALCRSRLAPLRRSTTRPPNSHQHRSRRSGVTAPGLARPPPPPFPSGSPDPADHGTPRATHAPHQPPCAVPPCAALRRSTTNHQNSHQRRSRRSGATAPGLARPPPPPFPSGNPDPADHGTPRATHAPHQPPFAVPPCAAAQVDHEPPELAPAPVSSQRRHGPRARAADGRKTRRWRTVPASVIRPELAPAPVSSQRRHGPRGRAADGRKTRRWRTVPASVIRLPP